VTDKEGKREWLFLPPPQGRWPTGEGDEGEERHGLGLRVVLEASFTDPLSAFQMNAGRILCLLGERRLLALSAETGRVLWHRWAPGAAFAGPAPRGRFNPHFLAGAGSVFVQVSGRLWLLDGETGEVRQAMPTPLLPWPRPPLPLNERTVCLVRDARTIQTVDRNTGKVLWSWTVPGATTRSGEPPLVLGDGERLVVVIPENIGYRLQRLDPASGKPVWDPPPLLSLDRLDAEGWVLAGGVVYHEGKGRVWARSLAEGKGCGSDRCRARRRGEDGS
jgi:hypothetical protein